MKHLIFGRNSWLGSKIDYYLKNHGGAGEISPADVTDLNALRKEIVNKKPDMVINAAAKRGRPNIDWCEDHKMETFTVNTIGALNVFTAAEEAGIRMVHLASGCVFDNAGYDEPVTENTKASPPSFYSWTKFWADEVLKNFPMLILRLRLPIDNQTNPNNLITKLAGYSKIIDAKNSATVIQDFLPALKKLIDIKAFGIYNVVNPGVLEYRTYMKLYTEIVDPNHKYEIIPPEDLERLGLAKAKRSNCLLSTAKLEREGIHLRPIDQAIRQTLIEYAQNQSN